MDAFLDWFWQPSDPFQTRTVIACFFIASLSTWYAIVYARKCRLVDLPGKRRSHKVPTPRGGGIGIVIAVLFAASVIQHRYDSSLLRLEWLLMDVIPIVLVAGIGWLDDHFGIPAIWRLLVHFAAAVCAMWPVLVSAIVWPAVFDKVLTPIPILNTLLVLAMCAAFVWSINLHNFMDGINGLLSVQTIFVFAVMMHFINGGAAVALLPLWIGSVAGFLPFNFPRARIFMGDVGSGLLGLLVAMIVFRQFESSPHAIHSGMIACSAFVTDATCTLLSRMFSGRRWYSAHREHLYQWMTRTGMSHVRVVSWYMGWNLLIVVPVLYLANRGDTPGSGFFWEVAVYALATLVWFIGKRWCLHKVKNAIKKKV